MPNALPVDDNVELPTITVRPDNPLPVQPPDISYMTGVPEDNSLNQLAADRLLGVNGQERYQTWPERLVRSALTAAHDVSETHKKIGKMLEEHDGKMWSDTDEAILQATGKTIVDRANDMAALAGVGTLGMAPAEATLGSGMVRMTKNEKIADLLKEHEIKGHEGTTWYHGSGRIDRVEKGIDPKKATSGPMPYFTDDPAIASSYSNNKVDTSLRAQDTGNVADYYTVNPKDLFPGTNMRRPISVEQSWNYLPPQVKADILEKAPRVGYQDLNTFEGPYTLHPPGVNATLSPNHWDYIMKTEAKGNPLAALREMWHDSGQIINNESDLATIYKMAGYPHNISEERAPWTEAKGVLPAKIQMKNPLDTSNSEEMLNKVLPALEEAFKRSRTKTKEYGVDPWAKDVRYSPKEWVEQAKQDYAAKDNSYVWTTIPDKVTAELRKLGYDGIIDTGGKAGGQEHRVAIPFDKKQVRSAITGRLLSDTTLPGVGMAAARSLTNRVYHGTQALPFEHFKPNTESYNLADQLGTHVAKDRTISENIATKGKSGGETVNGHVYDLHTLPDEHFLEVDQPHLPYIEDKTIPKTSKNVMHDDWQVERMIMKHAFEKDPSILARYLETARRVPKEDAPRLAQEMAAGKKVNLPVDGEGWDLDRFIRSFGGKPYNKEDRALAVNLFKKDMQEKGYGGLKYINTGVMEQEGPKAVADPTSYIVFDPSKHLLNTKTGKLMSDTTLPGVGMAAARSIAKPFYSAVEHAVQNAKQNVGTAEQWTGYLKNQPGVKQEELDWVLGELPKGKITKAELEQHVAAHKIELNEVNKGGNEAATAALRIKYKQMDDRLREIQDEFNNLHRFNNTSANERRAVLAKEEEQLKRERAKLQSELFNPSNSTKFSQWQMPGGENYQEKLLTLPDNSNAGFEVVPHPSGSGYAIKKPDGTFHEGWHGKGPAKWATEDLARDTGLPIANKSRYLKDWFGQELEAIKSVADVTEARKYNTHFRKEMDGFSDEEAFKLVQNAKTIKPEFKSSHWDEPNHVVHFRMNDRLIPDENGQHVSNLKEAQYKGYTSFVYGEGPLGGPAVYGVKPNGEKQLVRQNFKDQLEARNEVYRLNSEPIIKGHKTLHIEEIQSDWHQAGRKQGYVGEKEKLQPEFDKIEQKIMNSNDEKIMGNPDLKSALKDAVNKKIINENEARLYQRYTAIENGTPVPDAPFKQSWSDLALKRIIRHAAENGYDAISWTPGAKQAERYDLSKHVKSIRWEPQIKNEANIVRIDPHSGNTINLQVNRNGKVEASFPSSQGEQFVGRDLSDVVGKEIADKIVGNKEAGFLKDLDLKVGGEGMKGFYDKMLVDKANAIAKKYGGKVEQKSLQDTSNFYPVTDGNGKWRIYDPKTEDYAVGSNLTHGRSFASKEEAQKAIEDFVSSNNIHFLKLPQGLKDTATQKGFPLFTGNHMITPVDHNPFEDSDTITIDGKKIQVNKSRKIKITPVNHEPNFKAK